MENKNNIEQFDEFFKSNMQGFEPELPGDLWSNIDQASQAGQAGAGAAASKILTSVLIKAAAVLIPAALVTWYVLDGKQPQVSKPSTQVQNVSVETPDAHAPENKTFTGIDKTETTTANPDHEVSDVKSDDGNNPAATETGTKPNTKQNGSEQKAKTETTTGSTNEMPAVDGNPTAPKLKQTNSFGNTSAATRNEMSVSFVPEKPEVCFGEVIQLNNTTNGNFDSYYWDFDDGQTLTQTLKENITHRFERPGVYNVTLVGIKGQEKVTIGHKVKVVIVQAYYIIDQSLPAEVKFANQSKNATAFTWDFGDNSPLGTQKNPIHRFTGMDKVNVRMIAHNGNCSDTFQMEINPAVAALKDDIFIPNVITPDWDGINDVWQVKASNITSYHLVIVDKWGRRIFESDHASAGWNGVCSDGRVCAPGDYYFTLEISLAGKPQQVKTGMIKLIQ